MALDEEIRATIDPDVRLRAERVLAAVGLTAADAFRIMMTRVAADNRLPFDPLVPNETTQEAMRASRRGEGAAFASVAELMADLNADD